MNIRTFTSNLVMSVIAVLLGFTMMVWPQDAINVICYVMGGFIIINGIVDVITYFIKGDSALVIWYKLCVGTLKIVGGLVLIICSDYATIIATITIGLYLIIAGLFKVLSSYFLMATREKNGIINLLISIILVTIGIVLLSFDKSSTYLVFALGLSITIKGLISIFELFRKNYDALKREFQNKKNQNTSSKNNQNNKNIIDAEAEVIDDDDK